MKQKRRHDFSAIHTEKDGWHVTNYAHGRTGGKTWACSHASVIRLRRVCFVRELTLVVKCK